MSDLTPRSPLAPGRFRGTRPRGQSLVEFALILPVMLMILGGILDFGFMLNSRLTLVSAVREGARWAVVQKDVFTIRSNGTNSGLIQSGGQIGANLSGLQWAKVTNVGVGCTRAAGGSCDFAAGGLPDAARGDSITVSVTYAYSSLIGSLFGRNVSLGTQVRMVLEVPS
jgi:Flp pilus assembly protein TadG